MASLKNLAFGTIYILTLNVMSRIIADPVLSIAANHVELISSDDPSLRVRSIEGVRTDTQPNNAAAKDGATLDYPSNEVAVVDPTTDYELEKGVLELESPRNSPSKFNGGSKIFQSLQMPESSKYHQQFTAQLIEIPRDSPKQKTSFNKNDKADRNNRKKAIIRKMKKKVVSELRILAQLTVNSFSNVTQAAHLLINKLADETVSLAGVVAYLPQLILLDGPKQLLETLKIIREKSDQKSLSALDTVIIFLEADSEHAKNIRENVQPMFSFLPRVFQSVGEFFHTIFDTVWNLFE